MFKSKLSRCLFFCIIYFSFFWVHSQKELDITVGTNFHLTSALLPPKTLFSKVEFQEIFDKDFPGVSPELNINTFKTFGKHQIGLGGALILFRRLLSLSIPIVVTYSYDWFSKNSTPFIFSRLGHSFFITEGTIGTIGLGYKHEKFKFYLSYHNQEKKNASLMQNQFVSSRIASFAFGVSYDFHLKSSK